MKSLFIETAEQCVAHENCSDILNALPNVIRQHTGLDYALSRTDTGCFLKPTFRTMPHRNSFVPEINIVVSNNDTQTILLVQGQPVKFIRCFIAFWFGFLLMMDVVLLALAITGNLDSLFPFLVTVILHIFGYLLCKIGTRSTFRSIMKAIQKELK